MRHADPCHLLREIDGRNDVRYDVLELPADPGQSIVAYTAENDP